MMELVAYIDFYTPLEWSVPRNNNNSAWDECYIQGTT